MFQYVIKKNEVTSSCGNCPPAIADYTVVVNFGDRTETRIYGVEPTARLEAEKQARLQGFHDFNFIAQTDDNLTPHLVSLEEAELTLLEINSEKSKRGRKPKTQTN